MPNPRSAAAALILFVAADAAAQQRPAAPDDAVTQNGTSLLLGVTATTGQGADPTGEDAATSADPNQIYGGGQLTVSFLKRGRRLAFGAEGATGARYYTRDGRMQRLGERAAVNADFQIGRTRIAATQTIRRTPFQQLLQLGDGGVRIDLPVTTPDLAIRNEPMTSLTTSAGVSRPLGRRADLSFRYGFDESRAGSQVERRVYTAGGSLRRVITRDLDLRLGHTVRWSRSATNATAPSLTSHDLDLGFDYHRALSFSRRTSVSFASGAAAVSSEGNRQFLVTGAASLQHMLGRTWSAAATYDRRLTLIEGIAEPIVANGLTSTLGGGLGRRAGLRFRGSYMQGRIGIAASDESSTGAGSIRTFTTEARLLVTLWRSAQWYAEHFYYQHQLSETGGLSGGVPRSTARVGVRAGIEFQVPLVRRRR